MCPALHGPATLYTRLSLFSPNLLVTYVHLYISLFVKIFYNLHA
uniref:Uncharacterized protein n=1 Tax=Heterorhabditis bacteriophora TaxID=37862 RepID=A0A1I7WR29_HETBA